MFPVECEEVIDYDAVLTGRLTVEPDASKSVLKGAPGVPVTHRMINFRFHADHVTLYRMVFLVRQVMLVHVVPRDDAGNRITSQVPSYGNPLNVQSVFTRCRSLIANVISMFEVASDLSNC